MSRQPFELTEENYYSLDADKHYMSCSQYQSFLRCEAAEIARQRGIYTPLEQDALIHGQYFHSALESPEAFRAFCEAHFEDIYKTKTTKARGTEVTGKYAPYELLDRMLERLRQDPTVQRLLEKPGENEKMMVGEIGGLPWRMKMDKYCADRMIIDYKTTADILEQKWSEEQHSKVSFLEAYGYLMRAAVYSEIERQVTGKSGYAPFLILAVSKQDPPDLRAILLNDPPRYALELEKVKERLAHIQRLKDGAENPRRCGRCVWCRSTYQVHKILHYTDLVPEKWVDNLEFDDYGGADIFTAVQPGDRVLSSV